MVAEDTNAFPGMPGAKGTKVGAPHRAQDLQHQSFPRARQDHLHNSPGGKGRKLISEAGERAPEKTHRDSCLSPCTEPRTATGASAECWHSQAQVQVLAAEVWMTQSGAECGKCSLATKPREEQAGPGLPAAGRCDGSAAGAARALLTRHGRALITRVGRGDGPSSPSSAALSKPAGSWHGVAAHTSHSSNWTGCFGSPRATNKALAPCGPVLGGSSNGDQQRVG